MHIWHEGLECAEQFENTVNSLSYYSGAILVHMYSFKYYVNRFKD